MPREQSSATETYILCLYAVVPTIMAIVSFIAKLQLPKMEETGILNTEILIQRYSLALEENHFDLIQCDHPHTKDEMKICPIM